MPSGPYKKVRISMIEKRGKCRYEVGQTYDYEHPMRPPAGLCWALSHTLFPIVLACSLGAKSWEDNDPDRWYISCMSKKGTVWKVETVQ